jgi:pyridoxal phosphate enzyme (YggS family)
MICDNLKQIHERISEAAFRSNRSPEEIKLVAVSKRFPKEVISVAIDCGQYTFGENYVQESSEKIPFINQMHLQKDISWHFIGKLQTNKARKAAELFDVIETLDNVKLAKALDKNLAVLHRDLSVFIQVNIGREEQKSGVLPEDCKTLLEQIADCRHLRILGLMCMPPYFVDPEMVRPYFTNMRHLAENLVSSKLIGQHGPVQLSMGMSTDFEVAIEEGSTVVRLGTAVFGQRAA